MRAVLFCGPNWARLGRTGTTAAARAMNGAALPLVESQPPAERVNAWLGAVGRGVVVLGE